MLVAKKGIYFGEEGWKLTSWQELEEILEGLGDEVREGVDLEIEGETVNVLSKGASLTLTSYWAGEVETKFEYWLESNEE